MKHGKLPKLRELLKVPVGSRRYGYAEEESDKDTFILTPDTTLLCHDPEDDTAYFVWGIDVLRNQWGHPLTMGNLTGNCIGDKRIITFLESHRHTIIYAAPRKTVDFGLDYIAAGERNKFNSPIKAGLRTAMILFHMAEERGDPTLLSDEEKAVLIRARTGDVPPEERAEIYRRTICPANLDKLRRMPENTKVRDELFALLDKICKEETT